MRTTHLACVSIAVITFACSCMRANAAAQGNLEGTWRVTVTAVGDNRCGPAFTPPPPFLELAAFSAGGVMQETNTDLNFVSSSLNAALPFSASDGLGAWKKAESGFSVNFTKLLYDGGGHFVGEADFLEYIQVKGDTFSGVFTVQFNILNVGPVICGGGTAKARRVVAP